MSYPYGVRKKVVFFVFDEDENNLKKYVLCGKPSNFVARGSLRSCGREIVRQLISLGFLHPINDLVPLALFSDMGAFGEFVKQIEEKKNGKKIEV